MGILDKFGVRGDATLCVVILIGLLHCIAKDVLLMFPSMILMPHIFVVIANENVFNKHN